jgi:hypothetical protein
MSVNRDLRVSIIGAHGIHVVPADSLKEENICLLWLASGNDRPSRRPSSAAAEWLAGHAGDTIQ